jgi:hypothetical protein
MRGLAFTFKVNETERNIITALATRLQRTESDAVRWVVTNAARELGVSPDVQKSSVLPSAAAREEGQP